MFYMSNHNNSGSSWSWYHSYHYHTFTLVDVIHRDSIYMTPPNCSIKHCNPCIFHRQLHVPSHNIHKCIGSFTPATALLETERKDIWYKLILSSHAVASKPRSSLSYYRRNRGKPTIDFLFCSVLLPGDVLSSHQEACVTSVNAVLEGFIDSPSFGTI